MDSIEYRGFTIKLIWKGTATQPETGVTREDNTFTYSSSEHETGGYGATLQECKERIDEFLDSEPYNTWGNDAPLRQ